MTSRKNLRNTLRAQRRALTPQQYEQYADQFAQHFSKTKLFRTSRRIAFYFANDGELDPSGLMAIAWAMGKQCYLPVLMEIHDKRLLFAEYQPDIPLVDNQFGIPEPATAKRHCLAPRQLDLILMPLVAFDVRGNRIGMGGGYYDRSLAFLQHRSHWRKPVLTGIGYGFQQVNKIKSEPWDVPLRFVATENVLLTCSS